MYRRTTKSLIGLGATVSILLTGCASTDGGEASGSGITETITFGHVQPESHSTHTCMAQSFKEDIESADIGLDVQILSSGQGYSDSNEHLDALETGSLAATTAGLSQLGSRVEEFSIFEAVYVFDSIEDLTEAADGETLQSLRERVLDQNGIHVLATGYGGTRHLTSNVEVRTPEDMAGQKLRVIDAPIWIDNGAALGATPTPVAFGELYLALQQGVVDAQENPLPTIASNAFYEVQDYVSLTAHSIIGNQLMFSDVVWQRLNEQQQEVVKRAAQDAVAYYADCLVEEEAELIAEWSSDDSPITVIDDVDVEAFREAAFDHLAPIYSEKWDGVYLDLIGR